MRDSNDYKPWLDWLETQHDHMLENTIALAEINSGSLNAKGVNRVLAALHTLVAPLGGSAEIIAVDPFEKIQDDGSSRFFELGNCLKVSKHPLAPFKIFLCGHMDTVFSENSPFQRVTWLNKNTLNGPGVADLKGGLLVMIKALEAIERSPWAGKIGWEILFNSDEEIGSPGSAKLIEDAAKRCNVGMIYEPSLPDGTLAGRRKGSGNFSAICKGKAAHAGREHHLGRNALCALCEFICQLDRLNGKKDGVTINPAYFSSGDALNVVPDNAVAHFNIRTETLEDEAWCHQNIQKIVTTINQKDGIELKLSGAFSRKPKQMTEANEKLFELLKDCGLMLNQKIQWIATGGCCDGNNLAAAGVANIDTLGVIGGNIHSVNEYMLVDSLVPRAQLSALLMMMLANPKQQTDFKKSQHEK